MLAACATAGRTPSPRATPSVDAHQHLVSAAFAPIVRLPPRDGAALVRELDDAGIERAIVLSVAYSFADERKNLPDADALVRAENDWTSAEVSRHARRLVGFCGVNPLRDAALAELARCLALPGMAGIKLHVGNSGISLRVPAHLAALRAVFALAQQRRAPVLVHLRPRGGRDHGAQDAHVVLDSLLPLATDIELVIAHLGGAGPGYPPQADSVMAVFGAAVQRGDPRMRHVWFDVATAVTEETTPAEAALVAQRIREVGASRVLYGSDLSPPGGSVAAGWRVFRTTVPLDAADWTTITANRPRFLRRGGEERVTSRHTAVYPPSTR